MLKKMSVLITAMIMILGLAVMSEDVSAEEYEKNIILSCESKDIDINEIPEDRTVDLLVSIENNPGFIVLGLTFDFDKRLNYPDWVYCRKLEQEYEQNHKIRPSLFMFLDETDSLYVQVEIIGEDWVYDEDGPLMKMQFRIPDDAKIGDQYYINFVREDELNTRLFFVPNDYEKFDDKYFNVLNNAVIRIVGDNGSNNSSETYITEIKMDDNLINEELKDTSESKIEEKKETFLETNESIVSTMSSVKVESQTDISTITTLPVETSNVLLSTAISLGATSVSSIVTTEAEINEEIKIENNSLPLIIVSVVVVALGTVFIILKRRSNNG